ncbi:MAG TPA: DUF6754 domain-containing protein [Anaerolineales bacterium]|nr:DUF6754 domain-containing protein [Anaerolineales bacterium]
MNQLLSVITSYLGFLFALGCLGLILFFIFYEPARDFLNLRAIQAFSHFRREVDLSVEAGKRLHLSLGRGNIHDLQGGAAFIGLTILDRCAREASNSDRPPVSTSGDGVVTILSQDTLQYTYRSLATEQRYDPANARLTGLTPLAYAAGAMPVIQDEQVSANIFAGHFGSEVALLTEAGERSHSLTVVGSDNLPAQAVLYATSDEPLLGEELYAAGAYLGAGTAHTASLYMQDIVRWILVVIIVLGAILKLLGIL